MNEQDNRICELLFILLLAALLTSLLTHSL